MFTLKDLTDNITNKISEYIEFDIKEIFDQGDYIAIYGGAVRDSLANKDINDIDILCMSQSAKKLAQYIEKYDYTKLELYDKDKINMYKEILVINEPWTFINKNKKIIQIIRPNNNSNNYFYDIIRNVDISSCGVFIERKNGEIKLNESCKNSIDRKSVV